MKRFETFGGYLFDLLPAPLKKASGRANQFSIFFQVVGRIFDGMKADVFRVRAEANIVSASPSMLSVHGQDRGMLRFEGEDPELFRTRLMMKGVVASRAGTTEGIRSLVKSFGYENVTVEPLYQSDPARWAEATVWISGGNLVLDDREIIQQQINSIKPGTNLVTLMQEQVHSGTIFSGGYAEFAKIIDFWEV